MASSSLEAQIKFNREEIRQRCHELGEAAVLADLERMGLEFQSAIQKGTAWEWIYEQRINRESTTQSALRKTAYWTMAVAIATFVVALITALR